MILFNTLSLHQSEPAVLGGHDDDGTEEVAGHQLEVDEVLGKRLMAACDLVYSCKKGCDFSGHHDVTECVPYREDNCEL